MLAANFSFIFIINIIHVAEDPLLSPVEHPPIALIKILINYYIFQSVIIFQMWILMNFSFFSFPSQCITTDRLLKTSLIPLQSLSPSVLQSNSILGVKKKP